MFSPLLRAFMQTLRLMKSSEPIASGSARSFDRHSPKSLLQTGHVPVREPGNRKAGALTPTLHLTAQLLVRVMLGALMKGNTHLAALPW